MLLLVCPAATAESPLKWDSLRKDCDVKPGELIARFYFKAANVSKNAVVINDVKTSCGCTVARLPSLPWKLEPKQSGRIDVSVDLRGKTGTLFKTINVAGTNIDEILMVKVTIPPYDTNRVNALAADRNWNREMSALDHQAVFKNDCVKCHLEPAFGKSGEALYKVACGICHDAAHRATMVPDLGKLNKATTAEYWKQWVTDGKDGTLMPGFAASKGGPLDEGQINSLVEFLQTKYPAAAKADKPAKDAPKKDATLRRVESPRGASR